MNSHTPGPWDLIFKKGKFGVGKSKDSEFFCEVSSTEIIADALLIKSAPDMLDKLKQIAASKPADYDSVEFRAWAQRTAMRAVTRATQLKPIKVQK